MFDCPKVFFVSWTFLNHVHVDEEEGKYFEPVDNINKDIKGKFKLLQMQ